MKCMTKYVALDVHQATTVASVRGESGRVLARTVLPTEGPAIVEFFRGMRGAVHVTFEVGTQSQWLYELVAPLVDRVVVCDPRQVTRQGNKGDRVDADRLSELLRLGGLRAVYAQSAHRADLKELTRSYRTLVEDSTRVMLRIKALFRARGVKTPGAAVYHPTKRAQWLLQLTDRGAACAPDAGIESQSQPRAQGCVQRRGDGRCFTARTIAGILCGYGGPWYEGGDGASNAHP